MFVKKVHPNFRQKNVCTITCKFCQGGICKRGMKAILLADTRVELFSTDRIPAKYNEPIRKKNFDVYL